MSEKAHITADDLLLGDTAVNGEIGRRRTRVGREEVVSYGSAPISVIGEEMEPDEKLGKLHGNGLSSYAGERRKSRRANRIYGEGIRTGDLPVRSHARFTADPRDEELERDMVEMRRGVKPNGNASAANSRIRIVADEEREKERRQTSIPRVEIQHPDQDEIIVFEEQEQDSADERLHRRSRLGTKNRERDRSAARTIDTWERSEVGASTVMTSNPRGRSSVGGSGVKERDREKVRERDLSIPRSVDSWERSDIAESTILTQRARSRNGREMEREGGKLGRKSSARTIDTWERSEVGGSTVLSSGVKSREREKERIRERERDSGYEGEGQRWLGRKYEYTERERGHSPVPSRLGESKRDRKMWSERGSGMSGGRW